MFYQDVAAIDRWVYDQHLYFHDFCGRMKWLRRGDTQWKKINDDNDNHDCSFQDNKNKQQLEFHLQEF